MDLLIDEARLWWRMWSVRLAALAGMVAAWLAANPEQMQALLGLLPDGPMRIVASALLGFCVFALPTVARLARQPSPKTSPPDTRLTPDDPG